MNAEFCFHNVGQGGFYSGNIKSDEDDFVFVYDCGTLSPYKFITDAIEDFGGSMYGGDKLDLLVLSHMDADHVNGVSDLLKKCNIQRINVLVMPYMSLLERTILLSYYAKRKDKGNDNLEFYELIIDPVGFFLDKNIIIDYIVFISDEEDDDKQINNKEINDDRMLFDHPQCKFYGFENKEKEKKLYEENFERDQLVNRIFCVKNFKIEYYKKWKFEFWCNCNNINEDVYRKLCDKFIEIGLDVHDVNSVKSVFEDKRKELVECYGEVKKRPNDMSVVLLHYPIIKKVSSNFYWEIMKPFSDVCPFFSESYSLENVHGNLNKTLLLGDINLKSTIDQIWKYFNLADTNDEILVCAVPHHGSRHSWNKDILKRCMNTMFVVSSGIHGRFKHPHYDVVKQFQCCCNASLVWNNEYSKVYILFDCDN